MIVSPNSNPIHAIFQAFGDWPNVIARCPLPFQHGVQIGVVGTEKVPGNVTGPFPIIWTFAFTKFVVYPHNHIALRGTLFHSQPDFGRLGGLTIMYTDPRKAVHLTKGAPAIGRPPVRTQYVDVVLAPVPQLEGTPRSRDQFAHRQCAAHKEFAIDDSRLPRRPGCHRQGSEA